MATPQQLTSEASGFSNIPNQNAVIIYLLAEIAGVSDVQTMINGAACYTCIPAGLVGPIMIYLLNEIAAGGGGGGGNSEIIALTGSNAPGAAPAGGKGIAYNENGNIWTWNVTNSAWDPIV